jgi:hypothetical protein
MLAERAQTFVSDTDDQCARLALAVERAADELRVEFRGRVAAYDRDFADRLDSLRLALSDLTGS